MIGRQLAAMAALLAVGSGATLAEAQGRDLTWQQAAPLVMAWQHCNQRHRADPSACADEGQRAWDALGRLRPGEAPALTFPALPRETACDPRYWAQKLGSTTASSQAARQAARIAVQAMLRLYHCHVPPTPRSPQTAPPQPAAASKVLVCEQAFDRYRQAIEDANPDADPAVKTMAVDEFMKTIGCMSASTSASDVLACEEAMRRLVVEIGKAEPYADPAVKTMAVEARMRTIGCMPAAPQ